MSDLDEDQREHLSGTILAMIAATPGINTSDIILRLCYDAVYPVGGARPAPEPYAPDESDVTDALQGLLSEQSLIMIDRALTLEKQKYRIRGQ